MQLLVGDAREGGPSTAFTVFAIVVAASVVSTSSADAVSDNSGPLKCWISEFDECSATIVFPALVELRFYSYLPADRSLLETTMGDAKDCACFRSNYDVTHLTLALRPANQTATVAAQKLLALHSLVNLSYVSSLWLEGSGIYALPRYFFSSFSRLQRLTITNTSNSGGFAFDTESLQESLKSIDLTNNAFTYVSTDSVNTLNNLTKNARVLLAGNPFNCDCTLRPLYDWLLNGSGGSAVADKGSLTCSVGGAVQSLVRSESEIFTRCSVVDVSKHLDAAYVVMSVCLAVIIVILLLVMWRKASSYLSFCLNRRPNYAAVSV